MNSAKLRTKDQLSTFLSSQLSWRKKELIQVKKALQTPSLSPIEKAFLLRAGITILYAHWEGYIKVAATAYVCFVAMQRLRNQELATNFLAIAVKQQIDEAVQGKSLTLHSDVVEFFLTKLTERCRIDWEQVVNTKANLSSRNFRYILALLGLEYLPQYETKEKLIDANLLKNRHDAAHGEEFLGFDVDGFLAIYDIVVGNPQESTLGLLDLFHNQILNAVLLDRFRRATN